MPRIPPIWDSGARKEATELMEHLWATGDDAVRHRLAEILLAGPPEHLDARHPDPNERQAYRDRRVFDLLGLLSRNDAIPLPPELRTLQREIVQRHPEWRMREGGGLSR